MPLSTRAVSRLPGSCIGGSSAPPVEPPGASVWRESSARCPGWDDVRISNRWPRRPFPPRRRDAGRVTVTAPCSSRRKSCDRRSSSPAAIRAATVNVGLVAPRSTCESIGALTPLRSASSRSDSPQASRSALTRAPIAAGSSWSPAASTCSSGVTLAIRLYVITYKRYASRRAPRPADPAYSPAFDDAICSRFALATATEMARK